DREQEQLQTHEQDDDVFSVDENAGNGDAQQQRAEAEKMLQTDHGAPSSLRTASILIRRIRSSRFTCTWSDGFCTLVPLRLRRVRVTAAIRPTVRISAAISNGSRKSRNRVCPSQSMLDMPASAAGSSLGGVCRVRTPIIISISTSITAATRMPTGRKRTKPSRT